MDNYVLLLFRHECVTFSLSHRIIAITRAFFYADMAAVRIVLTALVCSINCDLRITSLLPCEKRTDMPEVIRTTHTPEALPALNIDASVQIDISNINAISTDIRPHEDITDNIRTCFS